MSITTSADFLVHPAKGLSLVCLAAALWATVGVANGLLTHGATIDAAFVGWLRTSLGALILLLVAESMKVPRAGPEGNQLPALLLIGIAGAVFQVSLFEAFSSVGVTITVAVTVCAPPLIVALGEAILHRRAPGFWILSALAIATLGVVLVLIKNTEAGLETHSVDTRGVIMLSAASISFSVIAVLVRITSQKIHPLRAAGNGLGISAVILMGVVIVSPEFQMPTLSGADFLIMIYIGVAATGGAYLAFVHGMKLCQTAGAGLAATMIEPVLAALFAAMLLRERLTLLEISGCGLMLMAMILLYTSTRRAVNAGS